MKILYKIDSYTLKLLKCLLCAVPVTAIAYGTFSWIKIGLFILVFGIAWRKIKLTKSPYQVIDEYAMKQKLDRKS